ncbi:MAG TPA: 2,4'-dihydroxyacetophenone dioxygenase family protein [Acidimicrobiales bacterium]|nr:2,4'-dihydroxyacetophenone dioxygenase family protein [Acidimicrobiales bacterium]
MTDLAVPTAILRHEEELPFVDLGDGSTLQLLQVDVDAGLWIIRTRFKPGMTVDTHKHTGSVYAFTMSGSWLYLEYPDSVNVAGSYLFEPAGSIHTLHVPESNTELTDVVFVIHGANLNLDADGNVTTVIDAGVVRDFYVALCEADGKPNPPVIGL